MKKILSKAEFLSHLAILANDVREGKVRLHIQACANALARTEGFLPDREFHEMVYEAMFQATRNAPSILGVVAAAEYAWERYQLLSKA